ncbi:hypothetical protein FC756_19940 [Lysinibacillus mangiferihumi]|uniref:Uncharacterized protein n=1 Tax=Lysinibacillus mangiferihumi TaxID=1130819 RepID=A0A4U2YK84_9BACI|nr:hypothetical protein [Lysinibacillus mangiferihumi]TKI60091.1 hypothetical protein FC756_19940 [Lysinibacillus mangiferihumi]
MQRLEEIQAFIQRVLKVQQEFEDYFRTHQDVFFFDLNPRFVRLQQDLYTHAIKLGIISISRDKDNNIGHVLLTKEAFNAITTKEQQVPWYIDESNKDWIAEHYKVTIDGIEMWNVDGRHKERVYQ